MPIRETPWPAGTPCWVDYGANDVAAAQSFYADVFGWGYSGGGPEYGGYLTCEVGGRSAAGMGPGMDPSVPPSWMTYFATDDADATAAAVTRAGGTLVMPPMEVGPMGRMVIAADPQGNRFGLWQSGLNTGVDVYNEPGSLVWTEAAVDDHSAARDFYGAVFGFTFEEIPDMGGYATFALADGRALGGLGPHSPGTAQGWSACFSVADTDGTVATVEKGGGSVLMAAQDSPYGRFAVVADPWGAPFALMQVSPE